MDPQELFLLLGLEDVRRAADLLEPARDAASVLDEAAAAGLDLAALTLELEREGIEAFCTSYRELLDCIESKVTRRADSVVPLS